MILFQQDWERYPSAIIDTGTTNTSFIRTSALLKSMGIKNHLFPLQLLNPDLKGIDPFSPNLSREEMALIAIECKQNFFYFIREVARAPGGSVSDPIKFKLNRGNLALYWLFFNHIMTILIQIRQTGKSFSVDTLMHYLLNIRSTDTKINLITKDDTLRTTNLNRIKDINDELPYYLNTRIKGDIANTEEIHFRTLNNIYKGHLPSKSPKQALNVGRGLTSPIFHIDEFAYLYNIAIMLGAALPAGTAAREISKRKGEPYGTILTTTVGKKDDRDGSYAYSIVQEAAEMTEKFYDCKDIDELYLVIRKNSSKGKLRVNCTYNHRQLGYTDEWLRQAIEDSMVSEEEIKRDFLNIWTSGSQISPIPAKYTDIIRLSEKVDYYTEISYPYGYILKWYIKEHEINSKMNNEDFIISLDTSDAAGNDDIGLNIRSIKSGSIVAAGVFNETNLILFSEWIVNLLVRFPRTLLIPERRSSGAVIIDYLLLMLPARNIDPFRRIYNKVVQEKDEFKDRYNEICKLTYYKDNEIYTKYKKLFGFATSGAGLTSRSELYSTVLLDAVKMTGDRVNDKKTIDQLLSLVIKNGRVDHPDGGHDDLCIAWLLSYWILIKGLNLDHYGINSRDILIENQINQIINDPLTLHKNKVKEQTRKEIDQLIEELRKERDNYIAYKLETRLQLLINSLDESDRKIYSTDDLINNLRESRRINNLRTRRFA